MLDLLTMIKLNNRKCLVLIIALFSFIHPLKAMDSNGSIQWMFLIFGLFGGLALFLYGMEQMSNGLKKSAGDRIRSIL